jgi:hypothetical protein
MINKIPFDIDFPIELFDGFKKVDFSNPDKKKEIFDRSIYRFLHYGNKNPLLEKRSQIYQGLSQKVVNLVNRNSSSLEVLSCSIFGSSLFSEKPGDFDFLIITDGNEFSLEETIVDLEEISSEGSRKDGRFSVGISVKGVDNFKRGICSPLSSVPEEYQKQIIYRTSSALFRRHIPVLGYDFLENRELFQKNLYAQASDLLINTFDLYYNDNERIKLSPNKRANKILSRIYEAVTYLNFADDAPEISELRKQIYNSINFGLPFEETKRLFNRVVSIYNNKTDGKFKNE